MTIQNFEYIWYAIGVGASILVSVLIAIISIRLVYAFVFSVLNTKYPL